MCGCEGGVFCWGEVAGEEVLRGGFGLEVTAVDWHCFPGGFVLASMIMDIVLRPSQREFLRGIF